MTEPRHVWWGELRHGGMLVAPAVLDGAIGEVGALDERAYDRLRAGWLKRIAGSDRTSADRDFTSTLLEGYLPLEGWQKASAVDATFKATAMTGEALRPDWALPDPDDETRALLLVKFDESDKIGVGRGRKTYARVLELLRASSAPLGLLTNGRQFRLIHAGPDYDAWAEWDAQTWFDEGEGRETLRGLAALLGDVGRLRSLIAAIYDSRSRQGDLAQVLGEQVRQGVELILGAADAETSRDSELNHALIHDPVTGARVPDDEVLAALYQAGTRIVMRLVLALYAESRDLLPGGNEAYHGSYGVESLYRTLSDASRDGAETADEHAAWRRILGLFRLIHDGSPHPDLTVPAYGGQLFRTGDIASSDPIARALAVIERTSIDDATVLRVLRLLKVGKVKVRKGRGATWVAGSVDFSDLRTEYIGIVYEGLIDYELRRAPANDPIVFLGIGRQPALPLSRLRDLTADELKKLLEAFTKDAKKAADTGEVDDEDENEDDDADDPDDSDRELEIEDDPDDAASETTDADARADALAWALTAVEQARLVRAPRGRNADLQKYQRQLEERARGLVRAVIPSGRVYLVASGGLRKGSGSFYTRPALSVPLAHRTLEPLCYTRVGERLVPRRPEEILALKVCEPAMGSGSFLVAALRYLVEALARSLHHHGLIRPDGTDATIVTLPFGTPSEAKEPEELLPLPPDDDRFEERLRAVLARHVVERCLYGVDANPMAVELAKLSLWVETLDRELPFEFLDHKLKTGNSLVGCWLHLVEDYPVCALDRDDGAGKTSNGSKWLKERFNEAKAQMPAVIRAMAGEDQLFNKAQLLDPAMIERLRARFDELHDLPRDTREAAHAALIGSTDYIAARAAMDSWCALWFWPAENELVPLPYSWGVLSGEQRATVEQIARQNRFFHWEIEFPDAFGRDRQGFDAVLGNPPWETAQQESLEFFSRHDPFYRAYTKTDALLKQKDLFAAVPGLDDQWSSYQTGFKSFSAFVKGAGSPFDARLGRGRAASDLEDNWATQRAARPRLSEPDHPYRLQGSGKLYTYKLFLELAHHLAGKSGRLGMLLPSGVYTDKGATDLRRVLLAQNVWEWCYCFENRDEIFPIHRSFKFAAIVVQRGGHTTALRAAFMRHDVMEWARPDEFAINLPIAAITRFSPATWSIMEFKDERDLDLTDRLYGDYRLLGAASARRGGVFSQEFNVSSDDKHFVPRRKLEHEGLLGSEDDARHPAVRARLRDAGVVPVYEGKSFLIHDAYFSSGSRPSVSKFVRIATIETVLEGKAQRSGTVRVAKAWASCRLIFRNVARSTDQRTMIPALLPGVPHGHSGATLDGLDEGYASLLAGLLGSLVLDYLVRMKVSANLSWFYIETLPVPDWSGSPFEERAGHLVRRLNAVGADFPEPAGDPLITAADRLAARLVLDALVCDVYGLLPSDLAHIATRFPIYDKRAGDHRYTNLIVPVYEAMVADGPDAAECKARELAVARREAGVGFGLDEMWQPADGWAKANHEAQDILEQAGVTV
ncbi:MAG: Eco57I restriction-modification methylase domain-containing protein [Solirubrobacteraceae bacterium]